jgi:putative membrane protein
MLTAMCIAAALAGIVHVLFFCMESLWWTRPQVRQRFGMSEQEAETTRLLAFNQGFYNLFLAIGTFAGLVICGSGRESEGLTLVTFTCGSMLAAAVVLASSSPKMLRGAVIQGIFPLIFLVMAGLRAFG